MVVYIYTIETTTDSNEGKNMTATRDFIASLWNGSESGAGVVPSASASDGHGAELPPSPAVAAPCYESMTGQQLIDAMIDRGFSAGEIAHYRQCPRSDRIVALLEREERSTAIASRAHPPAECLSRTVAICPDPSCGLEYDDITWRSRPVRGSGRVDGREVEYRRCSCGAIAERKVTP